jgi:hypothetical protein
VEELASGLEQVEVRISELKDKREIKGKSRRTLSKITQEM